MRKPATLHPGPVSHAREQPQQELNDKKRQQQKPAAARLSRVAVLAHHLLDRRAIHLVRLLLVVAMAAPMHFAATRRHELALSPVMGATHRVHRDTSAIIGKSQISSGVCLPCKEYEYQPYRCEVQYLPPWRQLHRTHGTPSRFGLANLLGECFYLKP